MHTTEHNTHRINDHKKLRYQEDGFIVFKAKSSY